MSIKTKVYWTLLFLSLTLVVRYFVAAMWGGEDFDRSVSQMELGGYVAMILDAFLVILLAAVVLALVLAFLFLLVMAIIFPFQKAIQITKEITDGTLVSLRVVLAAAISAFLFSFVVRDMFALFVNALRATVVALREYYQYDLVSQLRCLSITENYIGERLNAPSCFIDGISRASSILGSTGTQLVGELEYSGTMLVSFLVALSLFVLLSWVFYKISKDFQEVGYFWLGYLAIALFSVYLALASILAVPLLTAASGDGEIPEASELEADLRALVPKVEGPNQPETPVQSLVAVIASLPEKNSIAPFQYEYETRAAETDRKLTKLRSDVQPLSVKVVLQKENNIVAAVTEYQKELDISLGRKEAAVHFANLVQWFQREASQLDNALRQCEADVENLRGRHALVKHALETVPQTPNSLDGDRQVLFAFDRFDDAAAATEQSCSAYTYTQVPPQRERYGASLGTVGKSIGWLLGAEELQVALITGLLGFGLLGALLSLFVRLQLDEPNSDAVAQHIKDTGVADMGVVVFTGFGAALVVYLASYGGLAVVATESVGDPNPYIVFSAAFAGAVFSKTIWARARGAVKETPDNGE
ncbi:hypothetical protein [Shimia sp.]|uniref:hypothetical protein n=1 Tax=Shimia sp. TaxID=1954381 RepID=UPI003B8E40F1